MASRPSGVRDKTLASDSNRDYSDTKPKKRALEVENTPCAANVEPLSKRKASKESTNTMSRSTSPSGSNLKTKTGRISKATKGQPVHHCHCGKTYTRAEHLRRHQQNHKPGSFPCDVQGCDRAFYREDLLMRHKMKHDDPSGLSMLLQPHGCETSPRLLQDTSALGTQPSSIDPRTGAQHAQTKSQEGYISTAERHGPSTGLIADNTHSVMHDQSAFLADTSSFPSLANGYLTPQPVYGLYDSFSGPLHLDTEYSWMSRSSNLHASHSPASVNSMTPTPFWRGSSPAYPQLRTPNSETSFCVSRDEAATVSTFTTANFADSEPAFSPELRDLLERDDLVTPTSAPQAASFGANQYHHRVDNEQRYLDAFWECIHPSWPIIHKPTFCISNTSPLLLASMVTLGACSTGHQIDAANACIVHKRCLKVLRQRNVKNAHTYRLCDMQAVLLVALFSISRSRRPPLQLSEAFTNSYRSLAIEDVTTTADLLFASLDSLGSYQDQAVSAIPFDHEAKQRLLMAYYVLDQQHTAFFGRQEVNVPEFLPGSIFLPQPLSLWDMDFPSISNPSGQASGRYTAPPKQTLYAAMMEPRGLAASAETDSFDFFTSMLLTSYSSGDKEEEGISLPTIEASLFKSARAQLAWHTTHLCSNTPVRALLAVAGESWVMAEKLNSRAEYITAQQTIRDWARSAESKQALSHSRALLRLHSAHPKTAFVFHEWTLHLACLVLWACAYASHHPSTKHLRLAIPSSMSSLAAASAASDQKLEVDVDVLVRRCIAGDDQIAWRDVIRVLTWAKAKIAKTGATRFCGLTSGAVDVLGALVTKGEEQEWF